MNNLSVKSPRQSRGHRPTLGGGGGRPPPFPCPSVGLVV